MKRKQAQFMKLIIVLFTASVFLLSGCNKNVSSKQTALMGPQQENQNEEVVKKEYQIPEGLHSEYMLLVDMQTGKNMYTKRNEDTIYPASMTKVMTCLVALMKYPNLDQTITVTYENVEGLTELGASLAGFHVGEEITIRDALYGLLLPSGADAANILSDNVEGGREAFINDMNLLASKLNMKHTNFINTTGLHEPDHYSSLDDLKKLMMFAWKFESFQNIFSTPTYQSTPNNIHEDGLTLQSTRLLYGGGELWNGTFIGSKTGYTLEAGCCMISIAQIEGDYYMVISAYADGNPLNDHFHLEDAKRIYNQIAIDYYGTEENLEGDETIEPDTSQEENSENDDTQGQGGSFGDSTEETSKTFVE